MYRFIIPNNKGVFQAVLRLTESEKSFTLTLLHKTFCSKWKNGGMDDGKENSI